MTPTAWVVAGALMLLFLVIMALSYWNDNRSGKLGDPLSKGAGPRTPIKVKIDYDVIEADKLETKRKADKVRHDHQLFNYEQLNTLKIGDTLKRTGNHQVVKNRHRDELVLMSVSGRYEQISILELVEKYEIMIEDKRVTYTVNGWPMPPKFAFEDVEIQRK